jgi:hypothetical protein
VLEAEKLHSLPQTHAPAHIRPARHRRRPKKRRQRRTHGDRRRSDSPQRWEQSRSLRRAVREVRERERAVRAAAEVNEIDWTVRADPDPSAITLPSPSPQTTFRVIEGEGKECTSVQWCHPHACGGLCCVPKVEHLHSGGEVACPQCMVVCTQRQSAWCVSTECSERLTAGSSSCASTTAPPTSEHKLALQWFSACSAQGSSSTHSPLPTWLSQSYGAHTPDA